MLGMTTMPSAQAIGLVACICATAIVASPPAAAQAWEPTKSVTFVVPAGIGGGADQMARFMQTIVRKYNLMKQPFVVINRPVGAGEEAFLDFKGNARDPHKIMITLSNLFTTSYATGTPFTWKDMTPVAMLALDQFVLWVHADTPHKTATQYLDAIRAGEDRKFKMAGTGSKQEDQIITAALERQTNGKRFTYMPFPGGGAVAAQLAGKHVDSTVNNPIEAVAQWKGGSLRPLCLFDAKRSVYTAKVTATMSWGDIPTCREMGLRVEYQMLRGIFMRAAVSKPQVDFYIDLFTKVAATDEWKRFMEEGAFNQTFMIGDEFRTWLEAADKLHYELMKEAGFLPKPN